MSDFDCVPNEGIWRLVEILLVIAILPTKGRLNDNIHYYQMSLKYLIFLLNLFCMLVCIPGLNCSQTCKTVFPTVNNDAVLQYHRCSNDVCLICEVNKTMSGLMWRNEITRENITKNGFNIASLEKGMLNDCHDNLYSIRLDEPCARRKYGNYTCRQGDNVLQIYLLKEGESPVLLDNSEFKACAEDLQRLLLKKIKPKQTKT